MSELRLPTRSPAPNDHSEALANRFSVAQHTYFASLFSQFPTNSRKAYTLGQSTAQPR
jgi:hypothetical protein